MTANFVVDCSVAVAWYLEDEANPFTESVLQRLTVERAMVPDIFYLEASNTILTAQRRRRISPLQANQSLATLIELPIVIDHGCSRGFLRDILTLARTHTLSTYDAAYLELARREKLPLATQDGPLQKAAKAVRVPLLA